MDKLEKIATILVLVGALNWGLVGFFDWNLVESIFGTWTKFVYDAVGVAAVYSAYKLFKK